MGIVTPRSTGEAVPAFSFRALGGGSPLDGATSRTFTVPAGLLEIQMHHSTETFKNDPGVCSLQDSTGTTIVSTNVSVNPALPGYGSVWYLQTGGTYQINVTRGTAEVTVYLTPAG